jgi:beta-glucosidase
MDINTLIGLMTLEEKASLCSGVDFWHTQPIERLGIPAMMVSDGPHGLRKQDLTGDHLGINNSIKAVCFPTGCTVASSFDRGLIHEMGKILGNECQAEGVGVLLGPAMNIKRSPLCGRNFEYFSEDPLLSSTMAAAQIKGIQSQNVGTSIKHFLANNQEHRRMTSDSRVDERTLREIYLASFEIAVKEGKPWTVMCSYNKINGVYAAENHRFLTEVLRDEWGFDGFVVSDWGAVNNRVAGVKAGLDLEMPSSGGFNDRKIVEAVEKGELSLDVLDENIRRILSRVDRFFANRNDSAIFNRDVDHEKARIIAGESMVLLKNEGVLPMSKATKVAFIGEFAKKPRFQGGGSSHINCHKVSDALTCGLTRGMNVSYAQGYDLKKDQVDMQLIAEACQLAKEAEFAVLFVGLPDAYESEGYDRKHMLLPESHTILIRAVAEVQEKVIIVLHNGSPIEMPWINEVKGVLEAYLAGQAVGEAVIDLLLGEVNPSGKLAESFPLKLEDNPSFLFYVGEKDTVEYREGIFVGYRYYDKKKMEVLFPFGHGLSYTSFEYSNLIVSQSSIDDSQTLEINVDVTNVGSVVGKEVIQLYVNPSDKGVAIRPVRELKGYEKISLEPKETKTIQFVLDKRAFAYYNVDIKDWFVETGIYGIEVGASSRDIRLVDKVEVKSTHVLPRVYHLNSTIGDLLEDPIAALVIAPFMKRMDAVFGSNEEESNSSEAITHEMKLAMIKDLPIRNLVSFTQGQVSEEELLAAIQSI